MAAQVMMPQKKKSDASQLLEIGGTVAGGVLGGVFGGPAGAIGGASAGGNLAGSVGGMLGADNGGGAMGRRMQQANPTPSAPQVEDPIQALEQSRIALASAPPEIQQEYTPAIQAALFKARRGTA